MSNEISLLKEKLEAAEKRIKSLTETAQLYEQYIQRAGTVLNANRMAADKILDRCTDKLPNWVKKSLSEIVEDGKKGVIVSKDDPELQMNWGKEEVGAGCGTTEPVAWTPSLERSSAVHEDYGLVWDAISNNYVLK
jgi:hypothetical protein